MDSTSVDPEHPQGSHDKHKQMYEAASGGDWERAKAIIEANPEALTARIWSDGCTALHAAAARGRTEFVRQLVQRLDPKDLETKTEKDGYTALHLAAWTGNLGVARILVEKNPYLTELESKRYLPIEIPCAVDDDRGESRNLAWLLARKMRNFDAAKQSLFVTLTLAGFHDITLYLLKRLPEENRPDCALLVLMSFWDKPEDFPSVSKLTFWSNWIYKLAPVKSLLLKQGGDTETLSGSHTKLKSSNKWKEHALQYFKSKAWSAINIMAPGPCKRLSDKGQIREALPELLKLLWEYMGSSSSLSHADTNFILYESARVGIAEIIETFVESFPGMLSTEENLVADFEETDSFFAGLKGAVANRQEKVYNVMINMLTRSSALNRSFLMRRMKYKLLYIVADLPPTERLTRVSGAALQMQRELQWFQDLAKDSSPPFNSSFTQNDKSKIRASFNEKRKDFFEKAEKWTKDTSNSCMLVATLIATVVFAAIFTVPGGNIEDKGIPIYLKQPKFITFVVSDALALFSSTTSILMFLSILNSRFAVEDFLWHLPAKLIVGLAFLFIAMATMVTAFVSSLWILVDGSAKWVALLASILATIPISVFLILQLPLFVEMYKSTFGRGIFRP